VKITETEVRYVADLANLSLSEAEIQKFSHDLNDILAHIDTLNEVDTTGVAPMAQLLYQAGDMATLRPDSARPTLGTTAALANAALSGAGYYKVPKVIER
jgi:aspartyl-tRNA(Asn)/glutamyl-tRNA(Gln) amidotransferase subunit C